MTSEYFDSSDHQQVAATRARASAINNALDAIDTGLALLPTEANIKRGLINYAVDSGAADAYVVTLPYTPLALTDGMQVVFKASAINTGACTINVDSLGAKSIKRQDGSAPIAGDIAANKITELRYNSTSGYFEIQGSIGAAAGTGTMAAQNANAVAITGGTVSGITGTASINVTGNLLGDVTGDVLGDVIGVIKDADADTQIQLEESADEDIIRFDCAGSEVQSMGIYSATNGTVITRVPIDASAVSFGGKMETICYSQEYTVSGITDSIKQFTVGETLLGVTARVTEEVAGCVTINAGIAGDPDLFIEGLTVALGSAAGPASANDPSALPWTMTATEYVMITAVGGAANISAGKIRFEFYYRKFTAPTS